MVGSSRSIGLASNRMGLTLALIGVVSQIAVYSQRGRQLSTPTHGALTRDDRIHYQRAIEEVYWRHRLWPKENPQPKPNLDEVMPLSAIRAKVDDYLRQSEALERDGHRPMTGDLLQAEMARMVKQTKEPEMLKELWAALGNDPYVIAECLVKPSLAKRAIRTWYGQDTVELKWVQEEGRRGSVPRKLVSASARHTAGLRTRTVGAVGVWSNDSAVPDARYLHTAVWTGSELIVWGGAGGGGFLSTGWRYDPATDMWTATATSDAPSPRYIHTAVWTGREMIVWGGSGGGNTGGRYDPMTDLWSPTSTTNAPSPRAFHGAVWTGTEMIVWGGYDVDSLNTGGRYNPATDSWTATSSTNAPEERAFYTAVWTGREMIVWGGFHDNAVAVLNTGGRYDPATDEWAATDTSTAPHARYFHTAVWTGSEMIVWGGDAVGGLRFDGGRYDPATDSWTPTEASNAPSARFLQTAVWTGNEMIVWGGQDYSGTDRFLNTGGRYNPASDSWAATDATNPPTARSLHTAAWTDGEMIVWGGLDGSTTFNTGGRYDPATDTWTATAAGETRASPEFRSLAGTLAVSRF